MFLIVCCCVVCCNARVGAPDRARVCALRAFLCVCVLFAVFADVVFCCTRVRARPTLFSLSCLLCAIVVVVVVVVVVVDVVRECVRASRV